MGRLHRSKQREKRLLNQFCGTVGRRQALLVPLFVNAGSRLHRKHLQKGCLDGLVHCCVGKKVKSAPSRNWASQKANQCRRLSVVSIV